MKQGKQRFSDVEVWAKQVGSRSGDRTRMEAVAESVGTGVESVLEVGCGDGSGLQVIDGESSGTLRVGVDLHTAALTANRTREIGDIHFAAADASRLPFGSDSFDVVICAEVLEHFPDEMLRDVAGELARVARQKVVLTVPNRERLVRRMIVCPRCSHRFHLYGHLQSFDRRTLAGMLPGFRCSSMRAVGPRRDERLSVLDRPWRATRLPGEYVLCPDCGWEGRGDEVEGVQGRVLRRLLSRVAMRCLGRWGAPRWLLATFEPEGDG